jgi:rhombotail lipoprotein
VKLRLPIRVGLAFAPVESGSMDRFTETQKQALLDQLASSFNGRKGIAPVQVIPRNYLTSQGSFAELDKLKASFGIDLMVLVSYDQHQFSESSRLSFAYLTIFGAYLIQGEENDTRTARCSTPSSTTSRREPCSFTPSGRAPSREAPRRSTSRRLSGSGARKVSRMRGRTS